MQYIEILFIINFLACAVALASGMTLDHLLFKSLKKNHAGYYKSTGEPIIAMAAHTDFTWDNYLQLLKGAIFGYVMVFRGIPKNFPKNREIKRLAQAIRIAFTILLILLIPLVILGYLFFKSTSQF
jgi:hypothetical protein